MVRKVLQAFAEENFSNNYFPVLHDATTSEVKPFVLLVKKQRPFWKRPFKKLEFINIAGLEDLVKEDKKQGFIDAVNAKKQTQDNLEVDEYDDDEESAKSHTEVGLEAANFVEGNIKINCDLGELVLGKLDREYFKDPDMARILQETELDTKTMKRYENEELRIMYSVICSERFELKGKIQCEFSVDAGVSFIHQLKAKLRAHFKTKKIPPKAAKRNTRGPVYFRCAKVKYNKEDGKLELSELVGNVHRAVGDEDDEKVKEYRETTLAFKDEDDLAASLTDDDFKKLEIIKESVLMFKDQNREQRKERVKKYLKWFEEVLTTGEKRLTLSADNLLTDEDRDFLQAIFCPALPGNKSIVDLSSFDTDKIQGYAIVLKLIDELTDEKWDEIEKAWAE